MFMGTVKECDILDFTTNTWLIGPRMPTAVTGGSAVLVHDRFIFFAGGDVQSKGLLNKTWILDFLPWVEWSRGGRGDPMKRPSSSWMPGPKLPTSDVPIGVFPNICWVPGSESSFVVCQEERIALWDLESGGVTRSTGFD